MSIFLKKFKSSLASWLIATLIGALLLSNGITKGYVSVISIYLLLVFYYSFYSRKHIENKIGIFSTGFNPISVLSLFSRHDSSKSEVDNLRNQIETLKNELFVLKNQESHNSFLANHDPLTGLPNRRYTISLMENALNIARESNKGLLVIFIDLNGFKDVNDLYGHAVGDEVLVIVANRLMKEIHMPNCLSRLGGDEYLIGMLVEREELLDTNYIAAKFLAIISSPMVIDGMNLKVGASVGISAYPTHGNNINVLLDIADKKMYQVKSGNSDNSVSEDFADTNSVIINFPNSKVS